MKITTDRLRQIIKEELNFVLKENKNQKELDLFIQKLDNALKPFEKYLKLNEIIDYTPDNIVEWMIFSYSFVSNWESVKALLKEAVRLGVLDEETAEEIDAYGEEAKNELEEVVDKRNILVRAPAKAVGRLSKYFSLFAAIPAATAVLKTVNNIRAKVEARKQLPASGSLSATSDVPGSGAMSLSSEALAQEIDAAFDEFQQAAEAKAPEAIEAAEDFVEQPEEVRAQAAKKWTF